MKTDDLTRLFKTLSDPTRLRMIRLLAEHELSVMELADVTQLAQSRVSNHLKVLREENLVAERREGPWRHYRIESDQLAEPVRALLTGIRGAWQTDDQSLADSARLEQALAARHSRNGRFFDEVAGDWDDIRGQLFGDSIARELLRVFVPRDMVVADIGSGTGYVFELLGDRPRRLIAIDNSEGMLAVARRKVKALGLENVEFRLGDAHDPPIKAGEVSFATFVMVLHYLEDPAKALAAMGRCLAPGGRVFIADFTSHQQTWLRETMHHRRLGFTRDELAAWLAQGGFQLEAGAVVPGRPWTNSDGKKVEVPDALVMIGTKR